jgi:hypothetical protein
MASLKQLERREDSGRLLALLAALWLAKTSGANNLHNAKHQKSRKPSSGFSVFS